MKSEFRCYKNEFEHCTPPIMVSLASSTLSVPILVPKWGQNTTKERQDLHIPKYPIFTPHFWRYFCIFSVLPAVHGLFSSPYLWFGYHWLCLKLGNTFQYKTEVARQYLNVRTWWFADFMPKLWKMANDRWILVSTHWDIVLQPPFHGGICSLTSNKANDTQIIGKDC